MSELEKAFLKAQKKMEHVAKDATNPFFKSKYSTYESVVAAVKGPLNDVGLTYRHTSRFEGDKYLVGTYLIHSDTGEKSNVFEMPTKVGNPQETGSGLSYSRRYTLAALCGVASSEDDDGAAASSKAPLTEQQKIDRQKPPLTIYLGADEQKSEFKKLANDLGLSSIESLKKASEYCKKTPISNLKEKLLAFILEGHE